MGRILLNSGGGITIKDSEIVVLPDALDPEDCECCGPPQPPPPDCTRCYYIDPMTGLPVFYAPLQKDFAVVIADTTDSVTVTKRQYITETAWQAQCGCVSFMREFNYSITLTGFAGLNGTRYGVPSYSANPFGGVSSVGACNTSGMPFDPTMTTPVASCSPTPECEYDCQLQVWLKDVPIAGTLSCSQVNTFTCSSNPANSTSTSYNFTIPLAGYATVVSNLEPYNYGTSLILPYQIAANVYGSATTDYGVKSVYVSLNELFGSCSLGFPYISNKLPGNINLSCPTSATQEDLTCHPYWRVIRAANSDTCDTSIISPPLPQEIDYAACSFSDTYELINPDYLGCPYRVYKEVSLTRTPFYSSYTYLWS